VGPLLADDEIVGASGDQFITDQRLGGPVRLRDQLDPALTFDLHAPLAVRAQQLARRTDPRHGTSRRSRSLVTG